MAHVSVETALLKERLPAQDLIESHVRAALGEDVGSGDITASLLPPEQQAQAEVITREAAVLSGCAWFETVFRLLDADVRIDWRAADGDRVEPGQVLCRCSGRLRSLLTGERTALNYLQTLSGTATRARRYAEAVADLPVRLLDTRKTLPGLRREQKYAVACGGCHNHRIGLFDAILIKENHILAAGSIAAAVSAARALGGGLAGRGRGGITERAGAGAGGGGRARSAGQFPARRVTQRGLGQRWPGAAGGVRRYYPGRPACSRRDRCRRHLHRRPDQGRGCH